MAVAVSVQILVFFESLFVIAMLASMGVARAERRVDPVRR